MIEHFALDDDTDDERGDFPRLTAAHPPPAYGEFVEAMRTLQDLTVSLDAPEQVLTEALARARELAQLLAPYEAPEGRATAGRVSALPGRGSLLLPPWTVEHADADGVRAVGVLRRYHLGGGAAAHGGVLPLLFDDNFGRAVYEAGRSVSRTAYLHVNYRKVTPLNVPLVLDCKVEQIEGRKTFLSGRLTEADGTLLADGEALMIVLLPGQP